MSVSIPSYICIDTRPLTELDQIYIDLGKVDRPHFYDPRCRTLVSQLYLSFTHKCTCDILDAYDPYKMDPHLPFYKSSDYASCVIPRSK